MKRDVDMGQLSKSEASAGVAVIDAVASARALKHYEEVLAVTKAARKEIIVAIGKGLPVIEELPGGGYDAMKAIPAADLYRLIDAFAWASVRLHQAAQAVCDIDNLEDDGEGEGIVWEVKL